MSYYDPLYPSFQVTRLQLQRSFLALEEKLRLQRQLDFDLQNQQRSRRTAQLTALDQQRHYRQTYLDEERFFRHAYDRQLAQRIKFSQQEQENNLNHLSRLERLQRQRLRLGLQRQRGNSVGLKKQGYLQTRSPYKTFGRELGYDEDQTLIKKYEDGTRAQQFRNQMNSRTNYNSAAKISKYGLEQPIDRSPYKNLKYQSERKDMEKQLQTGLIGRFQNGRYDSRDKNISGSKNQHRNDFRAENGYRSSEKQEIFKKQANKEEIQSYQKDKNDLPKFGNGQNNLHQNKGILKNKSSPVPNAQKNPQNTIQEQSERNILRPATRSFKQDGQNDQTFADRLSRKNQRSSKKGQSISSRGRSRSQKDLYGSKRKKGQKSQYAPYGSYLDGNSQRSPSKTKRSGIKNAGLSRSRNVSGPVEHCAMEKIRNRLKLSYVVFKDSKFRNIRHELSHLFNTYDCELKLRKQLKQKINNHPTVLKKHAMVVS